MPIDEHQTGHHHARQPSRQTGHADHRPFMLRPMAHAVSMTMCSIALYAAMPETAGAQTVPAQQTQGGAQRNYSIPAGPLAPALRSLASSANILLTFTADQTNGKTIAGLNGAYTQQAALAALLSGMGLRAVQLENGSYVLRESAIETTKESGTTLPVVQVTAIAEPLNTLQSSSAVARLAGAVQDIPQMINVVPQEILQQQQVTTLEQALRNVPGITVAIGEANGGPNGDQFKIRGLEAKADAYLDGLRDFGVYVRDTFNTEQVEVLKGPSSENFGMGTGGGAINSQTKLAHLENASSAEATVGTGSMNRIAADINHKINDTTALRVNVMRHEQDIADRDGVKSDRWGVAASLGVGLGAGTTWHLNYVHQSNDRTPDFGQPMIGRTATEARKPVAEFGVPRAYYYGKDTDRDQTDADILTSLLRYTVNDSLTISNETRLGYYERTFSTTTPSCFSTNGACDQTGANRFFAGGNPAIVYGSGGGSSYFQRAAGIQNITTARLKFDTGTFKHDAVVGLDISRQTDDRQQYAYRTPNGSAAATKIPGTLWNPNTSSANYIVAINPAATNNIKESTQTNLAIFASDRIHFNPQWSVLGSLRYDSYKQDYRLKGTADANGTLTRTSPHFVSPKGSLIWEPDDQQTYYLSYGWASTFPFGGNLSADTNPIGGNAITQQLDPEKTTTLELGGKLSLLNKRLGLSGSIFQTTKDNTYYDDGTGNLTNTGYKQRITGLELGVTGQLTKAWSVFAGYTYLDSEILDATLANAAQIGNPVQGVPKNSASLWTAYDLTAQFSLPGRLTVGGGLAYRDKMHIRNDMMAKVPHSLSFDAMLAYEYKNFRLALTGYNLANRINYDNFFSGENANTARAIPSPGRSFMLNARASF